MAQTAPRSSSSGKLPDSPPELAEVVGLELERLLSTSLFRDAPTQQRLLRYLVAETLAGNARELKEYTIGLNVFHRGPDFDPRTDSIVRVQVGVLRKKLAHAYELPPPGLEIRIDVPRGQYSAHFQPLVPSVPPTVEAPRRTNWKPPALWLALGLVLGLALWLPFRRSAPTPADFAWRNHPLWRGFFNGDSPTQLVVGAPMFIQMGNLYMRDSTLNSPEELANSPSFQQFARQFTTPYRTDEIYTGLGEAAGIYTLGRFFTQSGRDLPLVRSRLTRWQDLAHSNLIILSSFRFHTLNQDLALPQAFAFEPANTLLRNLHPRPGEAATYSPQFRNTNDDHDYAVVSLWPSPQTGRQLLVLSGIHTWGTQGAADYVVDTPSLRELGPRIEADRPAQTAGLQVLVRVLVHDRQPVAYTYVTHRWIRP